MSNSAARDTFRKTVYGWLERENRNAPGPRYLEIAIIILICLNVIAVIIETVDVFYVRWKTVFDAFEQLSLMLFTIEYVARLWSAPEHANFRSRIHWMLRPHALIDLLAILPALLVYFVPIDLRLLRIFRLLRLLKLTRYSAALGMLLAVFEEEAGAFFAVFFILALMLILAACGAWMAEHQAQPEAFGSIPASMWWALATLTTVGYGDVVPITVAGKIFGAIIMVIGIGMAALPAGIIASGLSDQLHRRRASLRREFRKALEDGQICAEDELEIEALRTQLGLSRRVADDIREDLNYHQRELVKVCESCGQLITFKKNSSPS